MSGFKSQLPVSLMCQWSAVAHSTFYYKHGEQKPGRKPSTHTYMQDGSMVPNDQVVLQMKTILGTEFMDSYGYEYMSVELHRQQYIINHKKVYRLMDENNLLLDKPIRSTGPRNFVKYRRIEASHPMEYLCMDIKYVWVEGEQRNYYLLTVIDVYSKKVLEKMFKRSIRKHDIVKLLKRLDLRYNIKGVIIRNDNGPQFIAHLVKNFLRTADVRQEFSHPATPQDNSYIEAYHSILQLRVIDKNEFESFYEANCCIERFVDFYNTHPHRSIGFLTPEEKWQAGLLLRPSVKPPLAHGCEMSRTTTTSDCAPAVARTILDISQTGAYLCLTDGRNVREGNAPLNLNCFEKSVQKYGG
jgi:putative transposase